MPGYARCGHPARHRGLRVLAVLSAILGGLLPAERVGYVNEMHAASARRVLLVEPAAVEANVFSASRSLPLLGPLYLGTLLARAGFEVTVVSENLLARRLGPIDLDADWLLLSCLTPTVERGYELAAAFKRRNRRGRVVMGGPHVSFLREEALRYADHVVVGEGERVIAELLRDGASEKVVQGSPVEDLDDLPPIDLTLLARHELLRARPLMFSRGCPYGCNFCSVTAMFGRRYRVMGVPRVLDELTRVDRAYAFVYDDNFAANPTRTHLILDGMLSAGRRFDFGVQVRADVTRDRELVSKLARAGCTRVYVGFESVNDETLAELKKAQTANDLRHAIRVFHQHGISVHGMFIFGADADDTAAVRATTDFVREERVDSVQYMALTPLPGTALWRRLEAEGRLLHELWRYYDAMHVVFEPRAFSPVELQRLVVDTSARYYSVGGALNEGLVAAAVALGRLLGRPRGDATHGRVLLPSLHNAALRLMGSAIVRRWKRLNADYLAYLSALGRPSTGSAAAVSAGA